MRPVGLFSLLMALTGICAAQDTNFPVGPQYLMVNGSPQLYQPIATPTLSFTAAPVNAGEAASEVSAEEQAAYTPPRVSGTTDLSEIYWGGPNANGNTSQEAIEVGLASEKTSALPAGVMNVGVAELIDTSSLLERGYAMPLAEAARFWKIHKTRVSHIYTNADIARLHGG